MVFILISWNKNKPDKIKKEKLANDYVFKYYLINKSNNSYLNV